MKKILFSAAFFILFAFPVVSSAQTVEKAALLEQIRVLQQQVTILLQQLNSVLLEQVEEQKGEAVVIDSTSGTSVSLATIERSSTERPPGSKEEVLYSVTGASLTTPSGKQRYDLHEDVWDIFVDIAGTGFVSRNLAAFDVYYDPRGDTSAYTEPHGDGWVLGINIADVDLSRESWTRDTVHTLIHEYSHILFAEESAVAELFEEMFWDEKDYEHLGHVWNIHDVGERQDALYEYYLRNQDRFVSDYATLNPGEDIAESFTQFVINAKPTGENKRSEKILFFYNYPDIVSIRSSIRANVGNLLF